MAEGVLFNIAGGIIKSLSPLVAGGSGLLWGVQTELEKLQDTVSAIKGALMNAEQLQEANPEVRAWLERLNDVVYDADDLVDAVSTEVLRGQMMTQDKIAKKVRLFFLRSNQLVCGFRVGHKIKAIREKLNDTAADRKFLLDKSQLETTVEDLRRDDTQSYSGAEIIVGREDDKKAIINRLMESNTEGNVSIVSIVGIGGLGKTTLAKLIFQDEEIQRNFGLKMWVHVSDNFDVKIIVKKILESATKKNFETKELEILEDDLLKEIKGKKYLLVLDDIWNEDSEKWSYLKNQLMVGAKGSRILITTRKENLTWTMHAKPYCLGGLDEQASWELFKQVTFENEIGSDSLKEIGREIFKKCGGVPLAIKMVGRLLHFKRSEIEWRNFINEKFLKVPEMVTNIFPILKLSYDELPSHLKYCFAYCSLFSKDYEFDKVTLVNLWMAQGYVESKENQCLEDVGHEYFMDLLCRSFFQEVKVDKFGNIIGCKMHDLATLIARSLITKFPHKNTINCKKTRHIAVINDPNINSTMLSSLYKARMIRTFLCPYYEVEIDCEAIFSNFKFLRVLDLSERKLQNVPASISKLKHLRYLDFSKSKVKKLPNSITMLVNLQRLSLKFCCQLVKLPKNFKRLVNLRHLDVCGCRRLKCMPRGMKQLTNLQTLNLSSCGHLKELPRGIKKLVNLRHLDINDCSRLRYMPQGLRQLTNLQSLTIFMVDSDSLCKNSGGLDELNDLNNLRGELSIRGLSCGKDVMIEYKAANLKYKEHLNSLCLEWNYNGVVNNFEDDMSLEGLQPHPNLKYLKFVGYWCSRHPSWLSSLTSLVNLSLNGCSKWQYLPPLSHLPSLKHLRLHDVDSMEYISNGHDFSSSFASMIFFPSLKEIKLFKCPNLKRWWWDSSTEVGNLPYSFPHLSNLWISNCPMLTSLPMFPHVKEVLYLNNASWKPLQQTLMMTTSTTMASFMLSTSLFSPLSMLKKIELHSIMDLETLPKEGLQNLTSLKILKFQHCHKLKSLSPGLQYLSSIQGLYLWDCPMLQLVNNEDEMQWQGLKSLLSLSFLNLPKLFSLPLGLQHVSTLQKLLILSCDNLTIIAEWIHECKSLERLVIFGCSSLASLPVETCEVWSLQELKISHCPILMEKCEREKGEYWPKIAHIPHLNIDPPQERKSVPTLVPLVW